jgi:hypothetical protein
MLRQLGGTYHRQSILQRIQVLLRVARCRQQVQVMWLRSQLTVGRGRHKGSSRLVARLAVNAVPVDVSFGWADEEAVEELCFDG